MQSRKSAIVSERCTEKTIQAAERYMRVTNGDAQVHSCDAIGSLCARQMYIGTGARESLHRPAMSKCYSAPGCPSGCIAFSLARVQFHYSLSFLQLRFFILFCASSVYLFASLCYPSFLLSL